MITYGEFIDYIEKIAEDWRFVEGQTFLEEWKALATEEQWREYRSKVLEKGHVIAFAQDIAGYYRDVIRGTCVEELYYDRIKQGHDFLTEIHKKAIESGIEVKLEEVNQPLAIAETM
jgi:hypothetical protein